MATAKELCDGMNKVYENHGYISAPATKKRPALYSILHGQDKAWVHFKTWGHLGDILKKQKIRMLIFSTFQGQGGDTRNV